MSPKHILVVDDEPGIRLLVRRLLEPAGHRVSEAGNGQAALSMVKADRPDAILLDVQMPGMNGHQVLAALKADKTFNAPVIMLTAQDDWENLDAAMAAGADAYLTKLLTRDELLQKLEELLGK
ncbi:MAG: response regulator [candidate division WOR-3 bacterium]